MNISVSDVSKLIGHNHRCSYKDVEYIRNRLRCMAMGLPLPKTTRKVCDSPEKVKNCVWGIKMEPVAIKKLQEENSKVCKGISVKKFIPSLNLTINGKLDCIIKDGDEIEAIIEIKNRVNNFYIGKYEIDQFCLYSWIVGKPIYFIQFLNGEKKELLYTYEFCTQHVEKNILPKLLYQVAKI